MDRPWLRSCAIASEPAELVNTMTAKSRARSARRGLGVSGNIRAHNIGEGLMIVRMAPPPPPEFLPAAAYGEGEPNLSRTVAQSRGRRNCHLSTRKTGVSAWPDIPPLSEPTSALPIHFPGTLPEK